ncbi:MAG TPA: dTDP-glucose 4,6-dehydratase, partial [Actinobacteria bacterium]|nr:dTDP-glucose 4,6-dehydratase [Actinomycetes bacterium]HEX21157.1 dTDP-glucose 4,6-dehydratase [Actinomycetota bacterium]
GKNVRDWLYVEDNCAAIDEVLHKGLVGQVYNIGGRNELTNIEIAELILAQLGKDKSLIEYVADRPGHDRRYSITTEKVKKLGWFPTHNFKQALTETISWYKDNSDWWQPLLARNK